MVDQRRLDGSEADHWLTGFRSHGVLFVNGGTNVALDAWKHRGELEVGVWKVSGGRVCLLAVVASEALADELLDRPGFGRAIVSRRVPTLDDAAALARERIAKRDAVLADAERKMAAHHGKRWPYIRDRYMADYARIVDDAFGRDDL